LETLAFRVSLADASALENIDGITEIFSHMLLNKTMGCKVVEGTSEQKLVHLYDEETGVSIKDTIIAKNKTVAPSFVKYPKQPNLVGITRALAVVHAVSPSNFYCRLNDNQSQLENLMDALASSYKGKIIFIFIFIFSFSEENSNYSFN